MVDIFVPKARLKTPGKQVYPRDGEFLMDCRCGSKAWVIHVKPEADGCPLVTELVCTGCKSVFAMTDDSHVATTGQINLQPGVNWNGGKSQSGAN